MPLVAERLPAVVDQVIVFPASRPLLEVSVAVTAVALPAVRVKLEGETERVVEGSNDTVTVPTELPLLD